MTTTEELEPTAEEQQDLNEQAYALDQAIRDGLLVGRKTLWVVAKDLYEFDEISGWIKLGVETKAEWLADPEISITSATYYRLVGLWRELAVHRKVDPSELAELDTSKLALVLPRVQMGKTKLKDALDDAKALGWRDLRIKYAKAKEIGVTDDDDEDEDYIDGHEVEPAYPSEEMWEEIVDRAKRRRRNLVTYITQMTDWEKISEGDGTSREDWAIPDVIGDPSALDDEDDDELAQNGSSGDRAVIDREILAQARKDWKALSEDLLSVAESGQANPRVTGRFIRAGVQGANLLIGQRSDDERSTG